MWCNTTSIKKFFVFFPGGSRDVFGMERDRTKDEDSRDVIETELNIKDEYYDDGDITMDDDCDSNFR